MRTMNQSIHYVETLREKDGQTFHQYSHRLLFNPKNEKLTVNDVIKGNKMEDGGEIVCTTYHVNADHIYELTITYEGDLLTWWMLNHVSKNGKTLISVGKHQGPLLAEINRLIDMDYNGYILKESESILPDAGLIVVV